MRIKTLLVSIATLSVAGAIGIANAPAALADDCFVVRYTDRWGWPRERVECYRTTPYRYYGRSYDHRLWHRHNDSRLYHRDPWSNRSWSYDHRRYHDRYDDHRSPYRDRWYR